MTKARRFPFLAVDGALGEAGLMPFVPAIITSEGESVHTFGLLDTGATVNVLPFSTGSNLGLDWEKQSVALKLTGNLAGYDARAVILKVKIADFREVRLAFAWTRFDDVPLIFGQTNFFMEFNVCFFRAYLQFEISPKS